MLITCQCNTSLFFCHHEDILEQSVEKEGGKSDRKNLLEKQNFSKYSLK